MVAPNMVGTGVPGGGNTQASKKLKVKEFLTSGYFRRPNGVDTVEILLVGGGGGGGGIYCPVTASNYFWGIAGPGGGGAVVKRVIDITSVPVGQLIPITIGAGGAGGSTAGGAGGSGGSSSFGALLTVLGGGGGDGTAASASASGVATTGGSQVSNTNSTSGYYTGFLQSCGGGAGAHAPSGSGWRSVLQGVNNGSGASLFTAANSSQAGASGLYGYGGGGCPSSGNVLPVDGGAGQGNAASANTGGGGSPASSAQSVGVNASAVQRAGYAGGSGYALITWWE